MSVKLLKGNDVFEIDDEQVIECWSVGVLKVKKIWDIVIQVTQATQGTQASQANFN